MCFKSGLLFVDGVEKTGKNFKSVVKQKNRDEAGSNQWIINRKVKHLYVTNNIHIIKYIL